MSKRLYPLLLLNPLSDHYDEVMKLVDSGDVMLVSEVPSVTTVSKAGGVSWSFVYSAVGLTKQGKNFKDEWSKSADKGTALHTLAENMALFGELSDTALEAYIDDLGGEEMRGFATGLQSWWRANKPKNCRTEFMTFYFGADPPRTCVAGRADLYAQVGGQDCLIDFKTSGKPDHLTRYPKAFLANCAEIVARAKALEATGTNVDQCLIVRIASDGKHHTRRIQKDEWPGLFEQFCRWRDELEFKKDHKWD